MTVAGCLDSVRARLGRAARAAGVEPSAVTLIAVSKGHGREAVLAALAAGQRVFGENRVQEAQDKWPELRARFPDTELHGIGPVQTNKVKQACLLFDVVHSLDRERLARKFDSERATGGHCPKLMVQVNTGEESQKAGVRPRDAMDFVVFARDELRLPVAGLMCIPPAGEAPGAHFTMLSGMARALGLGALSMGMSGDYAEAICCGATHIRVGSAIFGARRPPSGAEFKDVA